MEERCEEKFLDNSMTPLSIENIYKIEDQMINYVCKIHRKGGLKGTGFFCRIRKNENDIPMLITNYHILDENCLKKGNIIKLSLNDEKEFKDIEINDGRKVFCDPYLDTTFIEINPKKDKIRKFLELDDKINNEEKNLNYIYSNKPIYILNYLKGEDIQVSFGFLSEIKNNDIYHTCITDSGSSGSPILCLNNFKVIGIHYGFYKSSTKNSGTFIKFAINKFLEKESIPNNNKEKDKSSKKTKNNKSHIINDSKNNNKRERNCLKYKELNGEIKKVNPYYYTGNNNTPKKKLENKIYKKKTKNRINIFKICHEDKNHYHNKVNGIFNEYNNTGNNRFPPDDINSYLDINVDCRKYMNYNDEETQINKKPINLKKCKSPDTSKNHQCYIDKYFNLINIKIKKKENYLIDSRNLPKHF